MACSQREVEEETGLMVTPVAFLGVFSSLCYDDPSGVNRGREICNLLFAGAVRGGTERPSEETLEVRWFKRDQLPSLSSGHAQRISVGYRWVSDPEFRVHFK